MAHSKIIYIFFHFSDVIIRYILGEYVEISLLLLGLKKLPNFQNERNLEFLLPTNHKRVCKGSIVYALKWMDKFCVSFTQEIIRVEYSDKCPRTFVISQ